MGEKKGANFSIWETGKKKVKIVFFKDYKYNWISSSLTTDGERTPKSVKSRVRY